MLGSFDLYCFHWYIRIRLPNHQQNQKTHEINMTNTKYYIQINPHISN